MILKDIFHSGSLIFVAESEELYSTSWMFFEEEES